MLLKEIKELEDDQTRRAIDRMTFNQDTNWKFVDENPYQFMMKEYDLKNQGNRKTCEI
jgi:hypothetical protein